MAMPHVLLMLSPLANSGIIPELFVVSEEVAEPEGDSMIPPISKKNCMKEEIYDEKLETKQ